MGSSFTNIHVREKSIRAVDRELKNLIGGEAYRSKPTNGWISVYDETTELQDISELQRLCAGLSSHLKTVVVAFLVHDSDAAVLLLYENGECADQFTSNSMDGSPTAAGWTGMPEVLLRYGQSGTSAEVVERLLQPHSGEITDQYWLEERRVWELAVFFGIDAEHAVTGFNYISNDVESVPFANALKKVNASRPKSMAKPIVCGDVEKVRQYLARRPDPNDLDDALHWALEFGQNEIIHLLLNAGARLEKVPNVVIYVAHRCDESVVQRVFKAISAGIQDLNTALLTTSGFPFRAGLIRYLLSAGADPRTANGAGVTPLMSAASWRQLETVKMLLDAGADPMATDCLGRTAKVLATLPVHSIRAYGTNGDESHVSEILALLSLAEQKS